MRDDPVLSDAARAVLDGAAVDWAALESSSAAGTRALVEELKVLSAVGGVHRAGIAAGPSPPSTHGAGGGGARDSWGNLRLLEKVGEGAFGEVYRAWDTRLDREVALKLLPVGEASSDEVSPIVHEGRLLARVRHPNVATVYGAEAIDGRIGLWMEFVHGRTLEDLLRSGHQFGVPEVVQIGRQLCDAVSAVHAAGLVHRDIKAANVMRADDGRVVLMDFGTGHERSDGAPRAAGTPLYLAPEIFRGEPATPQSDVYSVGVLLYHLLTGAYPVSAASFEALQRAHALEEPVDIGTARSDLPDALVRIVRRAILPDPQARYATCARVEADLGNLERQPRVWSRAPAWLTVGALTLAGWFGWNAIERPVAPGGERRDAVVAGDPGPTAASGRPIIAVRPFRNLSVGAESDLVADGFTYELVRNLAVIEGLSVRSASSSFALKNQDVSLAEIGGRLGADLVLEGSFQQADGMVRITALLEDVAGDRPIWSGRYDRALTDIVGIQEDIARSVVNELRLTLGEGQRRYDLDETSWTAYLMARALAERRGAENAARAAGLFREIIARDPAFAPAHAGLADAYAFMALELPDTGGLPLEDALAVMRPSAERALQLDPLLAEAHAALALVHARRFEWADADRAFRRALELHPSLTHVSTSYSLTTLVPMGRFREAEALLRDALERDPLSLEVRRELAFVQLTDGRYDEAISGLEKIRAIVPDFEFVVLLLARARSLAGRISEAMPYWESVSGRVGSQHWMAYAFVRAGRRAEIERLAASPQHPYRAALFHAALGDRDRALEALAQAAREAPHRTALLLVYPELSALRGDPRFEEIRRGFNLR